MDRSRGIASVVAMLVVASIALITMVMLRGTTVRSRLADNRLAASRAAESARSAAVRAICRLRKGMSANVGVESWADGIPNFGKIRGESLARLPELNGARYFSHMTTSRDGLARLIAGAAFGVEEYYVEVIIQNGPAEGNVDVLAWRPLQMGRQRPSRRQ